MQDLNLQSLDWRLVRLACGCIAILPTLQSMNSSMAKIRWTDVMTQNLVVIAGVWLLKKILPKRKDA